MKDKKLEKLTEKHGVILCLPEKEKERLSQKGYTVKEVETPCGANGNQSIER